MKRFFLSLLLFTGSFLSTAESFLYMPMDGSADVIGPDGKKIATGIVHGHAGYQPGIVGKALDVKRHAYDR